MKIHIYILLFSIVCLFTQSCTQDPPEPKTLVINQNTVSIGDNSETQIIELKSNTTWSIVSCPDWIDISPKSGNGNTSLTIKANANDSYEKREGKVTVNYLGDNSQQEIVVSIIQANKEGVVLRKTSATVDWESINLEIPYQYTTMPKISIIGSPDWIKLISTRALSYGKVAIGISENRGIARDAYVLFELGDKTDTFAVHQREYIPATAIKFACASPMIIDSNGDFPISLIITPENHSCKNFEWTSSNPNVATVSDNGVVTAISNGQTIINVKSKLDNLTSSLNVIVKIKATSISFVEWRDAIPPYISEGYKPIYDSINGSWGYKYEPILRILPENAYTDDLIFESSDESLVTISNNVIICNDSHRSGTATVIANLPYSEIKSTLKMEVKGYYIEALLGHIKQRYDRFDLKFAGSLWTPNTDDKFMIDGVTVVDENNNIVAYDFTLKDNGTNNVKWETGYVNLADYGMPLINQHFYETLAKWKAIITFSNNRYKEMGIISDSQSINPHSQQMN